MRIQPQAPPLDPPLVSLIEVTNVDEDSLMKSTN